jgi:hypothetical protein
MQHLLSLRQFEASGPSPVDIVKLDDRNWEPGAIEAVTRTSRNASLDASRDASRHIELALG